MILNRQTPSKMVRGNPGFLNIHSIFHTIQGEGPFCGTPAVFIRTAGCTLQCPLCDTEYTEGARYLEISDILREVQSLMPTGLVVLTGGEPLRQPIGDLCRELTLASYFVQIETNGTHPPPEGIEFSVETSARDGVYIVCSPKTGRVHPRLAAAACCYKYVALAEDLLEDGLPRTALGHVANPYLARPPSGYALPIYLQPADVQEEEENLRHRDAVVAACLKFGYTLQLQIHKFLNLP